MGGFNIRARSKDNHQSTCRECKNLYLRKHYRENRELYRRNVRKMRAKLREWVRAIKDRPCADCGLRYPHYVMDFDHRDRGKKAFTIGTAIALLANRATIEAEIAKCDVVCSNCHRERTFGPSSASTSG